MEVVEMILYFVIVKDNEWRLILLIEEWVFLTGVKEIQVLEAVCGWKERNLSDSIQVDLNPL